MQSLGTMTFTATSNMEYKARFFNLQHKGGLLHFIQFSTMYRIIKNQNVTQMNHGVQIAKKFLKQDTFA